MDTATSGNGHKVLFLLAVVTAAALGLGVAWWMAQPDHSIDSFTRLSGEIGCPCGTCPLRPIATCGCGYADGMLAELRDLVDSGQSDQQIMTTLITRYDPSVRIKPDVSGFGLAAWAAPILLLTMGAVVVGTVLARWTRRDINGGDNPTASSSPPAVPVPGNDERLRKIVERELGSLED